jgi:hypothetical protein
MEAAVLKTAARPMDNQKAGIVPPREWMLGN